MTAPRRPSRLALAVALAAFVVIAGGTTARTVRTLMVPAQPELNRPGLHDFRDVFYYPALALVQGVNPYDADTFMGTYPVKRAYAPYAPMMPLLHVPFTALPLMPSAWLFYVLNLGLLFVFARYLLRTCGAEPTAVAVTWVATLLLASRPGHFNAYVGQCTLYIGLLTLLALEHAARRPWLAGLAFGVVCAKPTFGVPLAALMIARRGWRAVLVGGVVALVLFAAAVALLLRSGDGAALLAAYRGAFANLESDPSANPLHSVIRIDAGALLAHLAGRTVGALESVVNGLILALGFAGVAHAHARARAAEGDLAREHDLRGRVLAVCTILVFGFHQTYDAMMLALPAVALATAGLLHEHRAARTALAVAIAVPALNYVGSFTVARLLGLAPESAGYRLLSSVNGAAVLACFAIAAFAAWLPAASARRRESALRTATA